MDRMTEKQTRWANSKLGQQMTTQRHAYTGRVTSWSPGGRGRGVWFVLDNGKGKVYRSFPKLRVT